MAQTNAFLQNVVRSAVWDSRAYIPFGITKQKFPKGPTSETNKTSSVIGYWEKRQTMSLVYEDALPNPHSTRLMLKNISDGLSNRDLNVLKFLCADIIPPSELEKVKNGFEIWKVLEDRALVGPRDYRFMAEILHFADRIDLVRKCANEREVSEKILHGDMLLSPFRVLLCKLGKEITRNDLEGVKYIFSEELSVSSREEVKDIWTFFLLLEKQGLLATGNVDCLKQIIDVIDKPALLDLIEQYQAALNSNQQMPNYRQYDQYCYSQENQTASLQGLGLKKAPYQYNRETVCKVTSPNPQIPGEIDSLFNRPIYIPPNQNNNLLLSTEDAVWLKYRLNPRAPNQEQHDLVKEIHSDAGEAKGLFVRCSDTAQHSNKGENQNPAESDQELRRAVIECHINQEPFTQELPAYPINAVPRGPCIIINNQVFKPNAECKKKLEDRPGSSVDEVNLSNLFRDLGFTIHVYTDCTVDKMKQIFKDLAKNDRVMKKSDALVVIILSHGKYGTVFGSDSKELKIIKILEYFQSDKCPGLQNKPKMFFFQACQGKGKQKLSDLVPGKIHTDHATEVEDDNMPQDADFFIGYATIPGFVSYRHEDRGSWYISSLVENLRKYSQTHDLLSIMTEVNRCVARHAVVDSENTYKQLPLPYTTLTRKVFLRPVNSQDSATKKA